MTFSKTYNDSCIFLKSKNTLQFYEGSSDAFAHLVHWYLWELHVLCVTCFIRSGVQKVFDPWLAIEKAVVRVRPSCELTNVPVMHLIIWFRLCALKSKIGTWLICRGK